MDLQSFRRRAQLLATAGALAFLVVLSFDWYEVSVEIGNALSVNEAASGWSSSWGLIAGGLAILLILAHRLPVRVRPDLAVLTAACAFVVSAGLAAFTGGADVDVAQTVAVQVETTLWPAWIGVGLAVAVGLAELVALLPTGRREPRAGTAFPGTA
jgi:hypothetical protein